MRPTPALLCLLLLSACGAAQDAPAPADTPEPPAASPTPPTDTAPQRPATRTAEIEIEGMAEPVTLRLYTAPPGFPLRFSTYLPEEMTAEPVSSGEGDAIRFVAGFGGVREERAVVTLFVHPAGTTELGARQHADAVAMGAGREPADAERRYDWSLHERQYHGASGLVGHVAVGRQGERFYSVAVEYPAEYGDGFAPRARLIVDEIDWGERQS